MDLATQHVDIEHTGPGTPAGRYLRSFWQPVGRSQDLATGQSLPVQIMGERFTLYRGEGGSAHIVAFRCAHRGTQLSTGWVEDDCIRCVYHGWKYDGSGQCVERPGEEDTAAVGVKIASYPTQEYLGLIFGYFGEGTPPAIKRFPDFEQGDVAVGPPQLWPCNYFNRIDNACDPIHVAFTHSTSAARLNPFATRQGPLPSAQVLAEETEYGVKTTFVGDVTGEHTIHFHMPNINQPRVSESSSESELASPWRERLFWRVPVDDDHCVSYMVGVLNLSALPEDVRERRRANAGKVTSEIDPNEVGEDILAGKMHLRDMHHGMNQRETFWVEDYVTEVGQGAIAERSNDRLSRFDSGILLVRRIWEREVRKFNQGDPTKAWASVGGLTPSHV